MVILQASKRASKQAGFTLIELLIVMGILGILGAVVVFLLNPAPKLESARDTSSAYYGANQWLDFPGVNGYAASNYTTAITGEITISARIRADDYTPAIHNNIASQWGTNHNFIFSIQQSNGNLFVHLKIGGVIYYDYSTVSLPSVGAIDGQSDIWVRWHHMPNSFSKFYYSFDNTNAESEVNWTQLGSTVSNNRNSRDSSTDPYRIGVHGTGSYDFFGRIYTVSIRDGDPTAARVLNPRFYYTKEWTTGDDASDTGIDDRGITWTLYNDAIIADGNSGLLN